MRSILRALENRSTSTGKLFTELALMKDRREFDSLLDALARAGLLSLSNDSFTSPEGKEITYRKATITHEGREPDDAALDTVWLRSPAGAGSGTGTKKAAKSRTGVTSSSRREAAPEELSGPAAELFEGLKRWRTTEAQPTKTPAFMILTDAVMRAIAHARPKTLVELHAISGMGQAKIDRFGAAILAVCRGEAAASAVITAPPRTAPAKSPRAATSSTRQQEPRIAASLTASARPAAKPARPATVAVELTAEQKALETKLREWRLEQARAAGLPSFFVLSDTALRGIAEVGPQTLGDLRNVHGVGIEQLDKYGAAVLEVCRA